ncbi:MAG: phosphoglycerate dehydrogenase [Solirubrobacteraceae bacterium]
MSDGKAKVLVKEKIGDSGVELLRRHFHVDLGVDWADGELEQRIGDYDGILIRSATKMTAELIAKGTRLRVIGRAGVGVDNVDVPAATARGVIVANAPESNVVTAAEHTLALLLALARNIPQAHASLTSGKWERSKFSGVELYEKTLGVLGFGRIGQLVAQRAKGFGMRVIAFDPFVSAERFRELAVEKMEKPEELYEQADFITIHLPKTPETQNWLDAKAFSQMRDGVRILNVARGGLLDEAALKDALASGKVAGAALDVFPSEPMTESPLFEHGNVIVTPHLGASTAEATDRAGYQSAEQIVAALTGGVVTTAVNIPSIGAEDMEMLGPFLPLASKLGKLAMTLAEGSSVERIEAAFMGKIAEFDTRLLSLAVISGALEGRSEEEVNLVNAPSIAQQRGIVVEEKTVSEAQDFNELIRVTVIAGGERVAVAGTGIGPNQLPHLVEVQGRRLTVELAPFVTVFRYADLPGMVGKVGTIFGRHGINISSAAVGHTPDGASRKRGAEAVADGAGAGSAGEGADGSQRLAAMVVTTDVAVPQDVVEEIAAEEGFERGWTIVLD